LDIIHVYTIRESRKLASGNTLSYIGKTNTNTFSAPSQPPFHANTVVEVLKCVRRSPAMSLFGIVERPLAKANRMTKASAVTTEKDELCTATHTSERSSAESHV